MRQVINCALFLPLHEMSVESDSNERSCCCDSVKDTVSASNSKQPLFTTGDYSHLLVTCHSEQLIDTIVSYDQLLTAAACQHLHHHSNNASSQRDSDDYLVPCDNDCSSRCREGRVLNGKIRLCLIQYLTATNSLLTCRMFA